MKFFSFPSRLPIDLESNEFLCFQAGSMITPSYDLAPMFQSFLLFPTVHFYRFSIQVLIYVFISYLGEETREHGYSHFY